MQKSELIVHLCTLVNAGAPYLPATNSVVMQGGNAGSHYQRVGKCSGNRLLFGMTPFQFSTGLSIGPEEGVSWYSFHIRGSH
jgi:hypothetical protein